MFKYVCDSACNIMFESESLEEIITGRWYLKGFIRIEYTGDFNALVDKHGLKQANNILYDMKQAERRKLSEAIEIDKRKHGPIWTHKTIEEIEAASEAEDDFYNNLALSKRNKK